MNKNAKKIIYLSALTIPFWFFSVFSLLGLKYLGNEESNLYWVVAALVSFLSYVLIFFSMVKKRYYRPIDIVLYLIPLLYLMIYFYTDNHYGLAFQTFIMFLIFVLPASYIGIELGRNKSINEYAKPLFFISLIISFGIFKTIPTLIVTDLNELVDIFAGGHYQALSYFAGLAFLITSIYFSFYISKRTFSTIIFFLFLLIGQVITIILSGGRGGLVLVVGGTLLIIFLKSRKGSFIPYTLGIVGFSYLFLNIFLSFDFGQGDRIIKGAMRLVSYIDSGGINFAQGSNRDIFYGQAIEYIKASPIIGHGFFTIYDQSPLPYFGLPGFYYPHNLFLEVLIHGGIIYLFLILTILIVFFLKLSAIISIDRSQVIILVPFLYSFIQLMFSGSYLQEALLWFSMFYVFSYPLQQPMIKQ